MKVQLPLLLFLSLFSVTMSYSQFSETISSDRPGQSNSANTVGKMVLQFQTGPQFDGASTDSDNINAFSWPAFIRFGITDKIEIQTLWSYKNRKVEFQNSEFTEKGLNSADFGLRFNIFEETDKAPALGFEVLYKTKIKSSDFKAGHPAAKLNLMASKTITDIFSITANLGTDFIKNAGQEGVYTLNFVLSINDELSVFFENYGIFNSSKFDTFFDFGGAYILNPNLQLDILGGFGYNDDIFSYLISGGVSYRIVKWRKNE